MAREQSTHLRESRPLCCKQLIDRSQLRVRRERIELGTNFAYIYRVHQYHIARPRRREYGWRPNAESRAGQILIVTAGAGVNGKQRGCRLADRR